MSREFGAIIKAARKRSGMLQGELGEKIGVSATTICELEAGDRKTAPSPELMVSISDKLNDAGMLHQYCGSCPLRSRISIRKFKPLNNIVGGVLPAVVKNIQKLSEATEYLQTMVPKLLTKGFEDSEEFIELRNDVGIKATDVRRGLEILFMQMIEAGVMTDADLKNIEDMQQRLCEEKGHHRPEVEG